MEEASSPCCPRLSRAALLYRSATQPHMALHRMSENSVTIPGFPETVSEKIDMPHIAELLSAPIFKIADPDLVLEKGAEFQKKLLSLTPIRNNMKHVTVYSSAHILAPGYRAMSAGNQDESHKEWHIDGLREDGREHLYPEETVHLLLSGSQFVTEFNMNPIEISDPELLRASLNRFNVLLNRRDSELDIVGSPIENDRIYTFQNHIHRATPPTRIELRYSWRVRETDRTDIPAREHQMPDRNVFYNAMTRRWETNIRRANSTVTLYYPEA